jgi:competence protein ComEA
MKHVSILSAFLFVLAVATAPLVANAQENSPPASKPAPATPATPATPAAPKAGATKAPAKEMKPAARALKLDLNGASRDELMKLPGVDSMLADKIIAARPFKSKSELVSKKLVTKVEYKKLSGMVKVATAAAPKKSH